MKCSDKQIMQREEFCCVTDVVVGDLIPVRIRRNAEACGLGQAESRTRLGGPEN